MTSANGKRKSFSDPEQERRKKAARKLDQSDVTNATESPSDRVLHNKDLVAMILQNVPTKELDTYSLVSRTFCAARNNKRLDQTRTGTIIFTTPIQQVPAATWHRWNEKVFIGNRIRLVAVLNKLVNGKVLSRDLSFGLDNVHHVVLLRWEERLPEGGPKLAEQPMASGLAECWFIKSIISFLKSLDVGGLAKSSLEFSHLNFPGNGFLGGLEEFRCLAPIGDETRTDLEDWRLNSLSGNYRMTDTTQVATLTRFHVHCYGVFLGEESAPPIEAYCKERHECDQEEEWVQYLDPDGPDDYVLLQEYPNLEHVTLVGAEYLERHDPASRQPTWKPLPQDALIKFVRHSTSLCWFRSDLSAENIAILKKERPGVDFSN